MKILFFPHHCISFNAFTLQERPLGGTETAVIHLGHALSELGHDVIITTSETNPKLSSPLYIPLSALGDVGHVDVLIAVRGWEPFFSEVKSSIKLLWTGDSYDQPANLGIGDLRVQNTIDYLCCVSTWHQKSLSQLSGFPYNKTYCLRNGIDPRRFLKKISRVPKRLIYSSTPYRGLKYLPQLYETLLKIHPDSSLHVCSGFDVYGGIGDYPTDVIDEFKLISERLSKLPGVEIIGNVTQEKLAEEFLSAEILSYPNTFEETSCITVLEAKAAGCIPVTSKRAALPESVGNSGICIPGEPGTEAYDTEFIKAIDEIFRNSNLADSLRNQCKLESKESHWEAIAVKFTDFLTQNLRS